VVALNDTVDARRLVTGHDHEPAGGGRGQERTRRASRTASRRRKHERGQAGVPFAIDVRARDRLPAHAAGGHRHPGRPMSDDYREQTREELEAHYGPGGPVEGAHPWLEAVFDDHNFDAAWRVMDENLRLVIAQDWVWSNRNHPHVRFSPRDEIARRRAGADTTHPLWRAFAAIHLNKLLDIGYDRARWRAATWPRPVAPGYELVLFIDTGGEQVVFDRPQDTYVDLKLLMRHDGERWLGRGLLREGARAGMATRLLDNADAAA
jgi:hypothetical protein